MPEHGRVAREQRAQQRDLRGQERIPRAAGVGDAHRAAHDHQQLIAADLVGSGTAAPACSARVSQRIPRAASAVATRSGPSVGVC